MFKKVKEFIKKKKAAFIAAVAAIPILAVSASAETTATTGSLGSLSSVVTSLLDVVTQLFNYIMGNWYLLIFFAAGLVGAGISIFKKIKNAAKAH